ncbi:MAG: DUF2442 domain-containing protein [Solirubrobacterales bacterium]|nr:DUF2442 domain-containing protein [Solirubrobacterales bacterium]
MIDDYVLRLTFDDGVVGDVSFAENDWCGVFQALQDPTVFAQVHVEEQFGTIAWPGDLDMAPEPLYDEARKHPVAATKAS